MTDKDWMGTKLPRLKRMANSNMKRYLVSFQYSGVYEGDFIECALLTIQQAAKIEELLVEAVERDTIRDYYIGPPQKKLTKFVDLFDSIKKATK